MNAYKDLSIRFLVLCLLLVASVSSQSCGDGNVDSGEECDDGNTDSTRDGCSSNCTIHELFECATVNNKSECTHVVVDFNKTSTDTLNYATVYSGIQAFLADPNLLNASAFGNEDWKEVRVEIFNSRNSLSEQITVEYSLAAQTNRMTSSEATEVRDSHSQSFSGNATIFKRTASLELRLLLLFLSYENNVGTPDSLPRRISVTVTDKYDVAAEAVNVTVTYVGLNANPPVITIADNIITFVEGSNASDRMFVTNGSLTINDTDNDYYEIQSATVRLLPCPDCPMEILSTTDQNSAVTITGHFNSSVLTLTGNASESVYQTLLNSVYYFNNASEPSRPLTRTVNFSVSDWDFTSSALVQITIINVNDKPLVTFDGNTSSTVYFTEGDPSLPLASHVNVSDSDHKTLARAIVNLTNGYTGDVLNIANESGNAIAVAPSANSTSLELNGNDSAANYSRLLSTVKFNNAESNPANVSSQTRQISFQVNDGVDWSDVVYANVVVTPVNDRPVFHFGSDPTQYSNQLNREVTFTEDGDAVSLLPANFTLRDVDSERLASVDISVNGVEFKDGASEGLVINHTLASALGITVAPSNLSQTGFTLSSSSSVDDYRKLLLTVQYNNAKTSEIGTGIRTVTFRAADEQGSNSDNVTVAITVKDRNDAPEINLGQGYGISDEVIFEEQGNPINFLTEPYRMEFKDEETSTLSMATVTLRSEPEGYLDLKDFVFVFGSPQTLAVETSSESGYNYTLTFTGEAEYKDYYTALSGVRYFSGEDEPSVYIGDTFYEIKRYIDVTIWDDGANSTLGGRFPKAKASLSTTVTIDLKNDNAPVLTLGTEPASCSASPPVPVSKRSIRDTFPNDDQLADVLSVASAQNKSAAMAAPPLVLSVSGFGATGERFDGGSTVTVKFRDDTNQPSLFFPHKIFDFSPAAVSETYHFAVWNDNRTLVVVFPKPMTEAESSQLSAAKSEFRINFNAPKGLCDCNRYICRADSRSCHVFGSYPLFDSDDAFHADSTDISFQWLLILLMLVGLVLAIVAVCSTRLTSDNKTARAKKINDRQTAGVEDVKVRENAGVNLKKTEINCQNRRGRVAVVKETENPV
eukprot:m.6762 g.6762  ORF g.6762 m.6762 type:complete len:1095 (+) comp16823_c0_seq1:241-3525(+)